LNFGSDPEYIPDTSQSKVPPHCDGWAAVHVCGCTGTTVNISLLHLHARTSSATTVSISRDGRWPGWECPTFDTLGLQPLFSALEVSHKLSAQV